jgi:ABC-2 type transport system ATP-binding protein
VNGLDPEGIVWVRHLMKRLACEGRTVFVSSHLMSEMQETAEHVVVIGRGRLIADMSIRDFVQRSAGNQVRVVSPRAAELAEAIARAGGTIASREDQSLIVTGLEASAIGELSLAAGIALHELSPEGANLESAFMELTRGDVEYRATDLPSTSAEEKA